MDTIPIDVYKLTQSFFDVLFLKIYIDSDDAHLKNMYQQHVDIHNAKLLTEAEKSLMDRFVDSGFDVYIPDHHPFSTQRVNVVDFKLKCCAMLYHQNGYEVSVHNSGFYMYPRSSLYKTNLRMSNSVGIIDSGYRGSLKGVFDYVCCAEYAERIVGQYERIVQICSPTLGPIYVEIVDNVEALGQTTRGHGGLGSTGIV